MALWLGNFLRKKLTLILNIAKVCKTFMENYTENIGLCETLLIVLLSTPHVYLSTHAFHCISGEKKKLNFRG